ncbi:MAG: hypothetical protein HY883_04715 [Deltaproteobacteria bacterium]|nr:hypothetical protein [Deltaproteobacteria bacterium]
MAEREIEVVISAPFIDASERVRGTESKQVKGTHKNGTYIMTALSMLIILTGCAGLMQARDASVNIKDKEEILVEKDIGRGKSVYHIEWCGKNGVTFDGDNVGVVLLDLLTKEKMQTGLTREDTILSCTLDGKKILYLDGESSRIYEEYEVLMDMYMYDTVTNKRTFVASVRNGGEYDALSPDGSKILLGEKHGSAGKAADLEWEGVWFTERRWKVYDAVWFPDSSGFLASTRYSDTLCVEFLGKDGWAKCFDLGNVNATSAKIDRKNNIYFVDERNVEEEEWPLKKNSFYRCAVKDRELSCERILEEYDVAPFYGILPNGDIIFQDGGNDRCIRQFTTDSKDARCVIDAHYGDVVYDRIYIEGVSPDGRWLLFERHNVPENVAEGPWREDFFVIDLKND